MGANCITIKYDPPPPAPAREGHDARNSKQGKKSWARRPAGVHTGEREGGAYGFLATMPMAGRWAFTNTRHKYYLLLR